MTFTEIEFWKMDIPVAEKPAISPELKSAEEVVRLSMAEIKANGYCYWTILRPEPAIIVLVCDDTAYGYFPWYPVFTLKEMDMLGEYDVLMSSMAWAAKKIGATLISIENAQ